ncbi:MAG: hypothetical protein OQJ81_11195 [Melioribacteraceae bacterium]|nr:hypothetical protein [Melioribacteraceae bacterium]
MKCSIIIEDITTIKEIDGFWSNEDYNELLNRLDFPDANQVAPEELQEMLFMAITDYKPEEAAEIVLTYKFSDKLSEGQIHNLAHEMIEDSVTEEFADISLHYPLFNINRLLYKAFNGKFPNTKASLITLEIKFPPNQKVKITKEIVLKALSKGLKDTNLVNRIFDEQIAGKVEFVEAESILWNFVKSDDGKITITTSDYWINEDDFIDTEFEGIINEYVKEEE